MRWFVLLLLLLAGCAAGPTETPSNVSSPLRPSPTPASNPLTVEITPDSSDSFAAVVARAPFTATFGVKISGGSAPYRFDWRFDGKRIEGESDKQDPAPFAFNEPGEHQVTVTVTDAEGESAQAARRIVALGRAAKTPAWKYGVTARFEQRRAGLYPTLAEVERAADLAKAAGIQVVRMDLNWDLLNPARGTWKYDDYDAVVRAVRSRGLELLGVLDYSSWWGSSAQSANDWRVRLYAPPRRAHEFAEYAYQVVSRYKGDVRAWEVWNEPNTAENWKPAPDPAAYVALLRETFLAIKYADPQATVVFGGLSGNGVDGDDASGLKSNFIAEAYAAGAQGYFDVMAIHPYILPNSGIDTLRNKIAATREVLDKHGDRQVPLWLTEIGAPNDAPWWPTAPLQTEAGVANWLEQVYTRLWDQSPTIFWYDLQDQGVGEAAEQHFGLLRLDFSAKPAYDRLRSLTAPEQP